jgi:hypothetical protein
MILPAVSKAQENLGKQMERILSAPGGLSERMAAMASGSPGKGSSALEAARRRPEAQAILAELERVQSRARGGKR